MFPKAMRIRDLLAPTKIMNRRQIQMGFANVLELVVFFPRISASDGSVNMYILISIGLSNLTIQRLGQSLYQQISMALSMLASIPNLITHTRLPIITKSSSCKASPRGIKVKIGNSNCEEITVRRTANYHPTIWDYDYVQSLRSDYVVGLS